MFELVYQICADETRGKCLVGFCRPVLPLWVFFIAPAAERGGDYCHGQRRKVGCAELNKFFFSTKISVKYDN